jgi:hypothetical protein
MLTTGGITALVLIIIVFLYISVPRIEQEGMANLEEIGRMQYDVHGSYDGINKYEGPTYRSEHTNDSYNSEMIDVNSRAHFYNSTLFKPECCGISNASSSRGCACTNNQQMSFLASRGGNGSTSYM